MCYLPANTCNICYPPTHPMTRATLLPTPLQHTLPSHQPPMTSTTFLPIPRSSHTLLPPPLTHATPCGFPLSRTSPTHCPPMAPPILPTLAPTLTLLLQLAWQPSQSLQACKSSYRPAGIGCFLSHTLSPSIFGGPQQQERRDREGK